MAIATRKSMKRTIFIAGVMLLHRRRFGVEDGFGSSGSMVIFTSAEEEAAVVDETSRRS